ncbi:HAD family hydrolase [Microbacterium sp. NPDC056234]|uniref:HAD family hydrolase n=1 Tax=Microbacterium sp. NPDC056234 TaxID=3345757 RepID=UPI0035DD12CA
MSLALFDLDGTLVDQARAAALWSAELGEQHSLSQDEITSVATALAARRSKGAVFHEIVDELGLREDPLRLWEAYRLRMPELVICADGVLAALSMLRTAGWTIGIVTNGEVDNQEGKIFRTGLSEAVDGWVISADAGARKPDRAIFELAARRLGVPLQGWMIGDGLESDIAGGAAAGLSTAWISDGIDNDETLLATIIVASVPDAVARILTTDARA